MKQIKSHLFLLLSLLFSIFALSACSWEDLPSYEEANISAVQFYYRWASNVKDPITQEPIVKEVRLNTTSVVDADAGTIEATVTVPAASGDFTTAVRNQVSQHPLWAQVTVSTAARITPVDGAAALGTPDDWSQARKFSVKAANGNTKIWKIKIVQFTR